MPDAWLGTPRPLPHQDGGGEGPPILFGLRAADARPWLPRLGPLGGVWRVIACVAGPGEPWDRGRDLLGLLDHRGIERAVLAGVGDGVGGVLRAALLAPDRVRGLVLIGPEADGERPGGADLTDRLEEIEAPALVVHGSADDPAALAVAQELCDGLHDCRGLVLIDGAAGAPLETHPEAVVDALRPFLEALPG